MFEPCLFMPGMLAGVLLVYLFLLELSPLAKVGYVVYV